MNDGDFDVLKAMDAPLPETLQAIVKIRGCFQHGSEAGVEQHPANSSRVCPAHNHAAVVGDSFTKESV